ncbi:hypothetical protein J6590_078474 [Homalodisca vitripennis]|nr:hypothetical protein J6590_078474 [Homalodisca vitripennis]
MDDPIKFGEVIHHDQDVLNLLEDLCRGPYTAISNLSRQSRNAVRIRSIANEITEEEQEVVREERRVSVARLRASQSREQREAARKTARLEIQNCHNTQEEIFQV